MRNPNTSIVTHCVHMRMRYIIGCQLKFSPYEAIACETRRLLEVTCLKRFEDRSDGGITITDNEAQIHLTPQEAYALWQWLSARKEALQEQAKENQIELQIHLYQQDLGYLDELK